VRRFFSTLLLLLFMVPLVSPLLSASTVDTNIPICCRRNGKHHCIMAAEFRSSSNNATGTTTLNLHERCPYNLTSLIAISLSFIPDSIPPAIFAGNVSNSEPLNQTKTRHCLSLDRSHQKRGPPFLILSQS
jgi:hypothetical protein